MKTRYCFVSNSSSSSFIVAFERKPKSVNELKCLLFDNEPEYPSVWRKSRSEIQELMDEYHSQLDDYRQKVADDFLKRVGEHCLLYCFSYSDENGQLYSAMEHGGLFERLPHITISHH